MIIHSLVIVGLTGGLVALVRSGGGLIWSMMYAGMLQVAAVVVAATQECIFANLWANCLWCNISMIEFIRIC